MNAGDGAVAAAHGRVAGPSPARFPDRVHARARARACARLRGRLRAHWWVGLLAAAIAALAIAAPPARAQEYSHFLACSGSLAVPGAAATPEPREATLALALRQNNRSALIEASNVLPVGELLRFVATPSRYTLVYLLPPQGTLVFGVPGWWSTTLLVLYPDLQRLNQVRLSIDRHSGVLQGQLLNEQGGLLANLAMRCAVREKTTEPPRL